MTSQSIETSTGIPDRGGHCQNRPPPPPEQQKGFAASLAHELNNPLETLRNLLYLIDRKLSSSKEGRHYLALAGEEVSRISQILHAAISEFRDTADPAAPEDTNVPELLRSVLDFYHSRFESHGISVKTRYCQNENVPVYPRQLRQMFSNLLMNAVDAMPAGGKMQVRVSPAHEWNGGGRSGLRLTFADNGNGIAKTDLPRILDPFFTTKGAAGNGIGLSLVKNTVNNHHGVLRVRSSTKPGRSGTVFAIFLPC
jgi:signal transduction histidine kinase